MNINLIIVIVRTTETMRAALNQFFARRYEVDEAKLPQKIWAFLQLVDLLNASPWAIVSNDFLLNTALLRFSGCFLQFNNLC